MDEISVYAFYVIQSCFSSNKFVATDYYFFSSLFHASKNICIIFVFNTIVRMIYREQHFYIPLHHLVVRKRINELQKYKNLIKKLNKPLVIFGIF